jgi:hypothetical protein
MRIPLHLGLIIALSGTALAQSAAPDVSSLQAAPASTVADLSTSYSGHDLTLTECTDRLERLGALLRDRGYGAQRDDSFDTGFTVTRWYDRQTNSTVVAWMSPSGNQHDLGVGVYTWNVRWNEMLLPF